MHTCQYLEVCIFAKQLLKCITQVVAIVTVFTARRRVIIAIIHVFTNHLQIGKVLLQSFSLALLSAYFLPKFVAWAHSIIVTKLRPSTSYTTHNNWQY